MSRYTLNEGLFLYPTPSGTYHTVSSKETDKSRQLIRALLEQEKTPPLDKENLRRLSNIDDDEKCLQLLHHCQKLGWVQGVNREIHYPQEALENLLPELLSNISGKAKILLADNQGFYLACNGYAHEVAEELSALSAEIATVQERRSGVLMNNLGLASHAWAVVDVAGNSQIGFWPVFVGSHRFVITISGMPHFNHPEFVTLMWALSIRYA